MFLRRVAVFVTSAHKLFLKKGDKFPMMSKVFLLINGVASFLSTWPFCFGVLGTVYSN